MPTLLRAFARRDEAVNEVMGYIMMFLLSAVVLVMSLQSFTASKESSEEIVATAEAQSLANRVAGHLLEMSKAADEFPNASYSVTFTVPEQIAGEPYYVEATPASVAVETVSGSLRATSSTYKLDTIPGLTLGGRTHSGDGRIAIHYEKDALGRKWLNVTGGS